MIVSFFPIFLVDLIGSVLMIVLSFLCLRIVFTLRKRDSNNLIWTYLLWICIGLACFAVSRSAGHILKNVLIMVGYKSVWQTIRPFSGAVNTIMFIVVAAITLFFERIWKIYQLILKDRQAIAAAHQELLFLNQNLEERVEKRTIELKASEYKHRQIFEASRDMIIVTRKNGLVLNLNPAGYKLLGMDAVEKNAAASHYLQDFLFNRNEWHTIENVIAHEGSLSSFELDLKTVDGVAKRSLISGSIAKSPGEEEDTILLLAKDIEQRRLMEKQLAQADKLASIGELSSGVAHEINNPLGIILGYTQLLLKEERPDSERYTDFKTIEKHVRGCKTIVEDLLSFARTSPSKRETADIHLIINDVIAFLQHHSGIEKIDIQKHFDPALCPVVLDKKKIKQVIMNLLMNARHAIGQSGTIEITTRLNKQDQSIDIHVRDTGYGIQKNDLPRIFDPFFTTKPTGEGTGLGLSVSYGIIKGHGGNITVKSEPGKGSQFTVSLPVTA
jgi:two-component system, NtrC family, sensor kinase